MKPGACVEHHPSLSLWQVLQALPLLIALPFVVAIGVFHENDGRTWRRAAHIAAARYLLRARTWAIWELRFALGGTTAQDYSAWVRKNRVEALTDELPKGAKLHWIGPRREDRVILYFHGGGYILPAGPDTFEMLGSLQKEFKGAVGIAVLDYSLAPECPFPTQLRQATAAVHHLLEKGTSPSDIIIAGNSAGGNLALQFASLVLHPHMSLPLPPTIRSPRVDVNPSSESQQPFGGLLLISPWVEFSTDAPSCTRNGDRDIAPISMYQLYADGVRPGISPALRCHLEPSLAPPGWWSGLRVVFPRVLITGGEHEGIIDPILTTAATISEEVQDTTVFVLPVGVHEDFVQAFGSGEGGKGDDYKLVVSWVSKTLEL